MQSMLKVLTVWLCLCVGKTWFSQGSQFGQVVPDRTTDELFSNVGRVDVNFTVNGETAELDVVVEDTIEEKELWLLDFQPYRFQTTTPINPQTGYLRSSQTGQCSNIKKDQSWDNQYFDDGFFQSHNSSGVKHLFSRYLRGFDDTLLGIRLDEIRYAGELDTLLKCERSNGVNIWDYTISFEEIQYTTILYATNIRPVPGWTPGGAVHVPAVAYVQTHFKLMWRLSRIAIINFVISSVTVPTLNERLLKEIGRLIVTFEFAIVEPVLKSDGTPDLSRAHVQLGFSTQLPARNRTMVVYKNGTETYEPDVQGNTLEEVISSPPYTLDDTPLCNLRRPDYCLQFWEFEMILKMDLSSLKQEHPLDATGVFQFNFDSYNCTDLMSNSECTLASDLPPWGVRIDLTLQTTVGVVDEETDSVSVSVVKLANGKGEDLRGGRTINHMENITLEVRITPAFLRNDYILELQLFMVCIGDQHMKSSRGCLGASEDKRYSAYVGDDLSFDYDPMYDPEYLATLQALEAFHADTSEDEETAIPSTNLPTYNVEKILSQEYSIWDDVVADSIFIRPYNPSLLAALGKPSLSLHFLKDQSPDDDGLASFYLLEPNINSTSIQSTIIADEHSFQEHFAYGNYHILGTVLARTKRNQDPNLEMVFSALTREPGIVSYVGISNPNALPCHEFNNEKLYRFIYTPNWVDLLPKACQFLMDLVDLKVLVQEHVAQSSFSDLPSHSPQDVYLFPETLGSLHLQPSFFDRLVELGINSDWEEVNQLLYATLLFQTKNILDAFEPGGLLGNLRNRVKFLADSTLGFNDHILESVNHLSSNAHVSLAERLLYILNRTRDATNKTTYMEPSLDSFDDTDWETVYINEMFYRFLWEITFLGTSYYQGKTFTTHSQNTAVTLEDNQCVGSQYLAGYWERCRIDWLEVIPFWTYILPYVTTVEALPGGWGFWSEWEECSLTCGGGIHWRYRECIDTETGCSGPSSQGGNCNEEDCLRYDKDDFLLVFKATSNIGSSIYDLWASSEYTPDFNSSPQLFKSSLVDEWSDTITVEEVKVALLRDGQLVLELVFDGRDSTKMNWFSEERLKTSPYEDIKSERKNFFSIEGHQGLGRRFFISHQYNGCGRQIGWLVVLDSGHHMRPCPWEKWPHYPAFYYSKDNTRTNFKAGQVGRADEFAVYIKYNATAYTPPPPTPPPPVHYTRQMISPPPLGTELNLHEYDMEKHVHRSQLPNTALAQERNVYTMTTIYSLMRREDARIKRAGNRFKRTLIASTDLPQNAHFVSEGCPPGSVHNPIELTCECREEDQIYSTETFQCESTGQNSPVEVTEKNVTPEKGNPPPSSCSRNSCLSLQIVIMICFIPHILSR